MANHIDEIEFTIFDTETTGLDPQGGDRIVEIAGLRFKGDEQIATFHSLVDPGRPISSAAFAVNGITPQMLAGAPSSERVLPEFLDFIKDSCLCSYNAGFDLGFLNSELGIIGRRPLQEVIVIDILRMARRLLPGLQRYALWFVAEKLGVQSRQEHRAFSDVQLTLEVFRRLKGNLQGKGVVEFSIFSHLFSINNQKVNAVINQRLAEIQEAINLGLKLKIQYLSGINGKVSQRQVLPKEIKQERNQFYLVAFCFLRNEERTFRVESILRLEVVA